MFSWEGGAFDAVVGKAGRQTDGAGQRDTAQQDLRETQSEDFLLHAPKALRREFKSDDEQEQDDAQFGYGNLAFGFARQAENLRSDNRARDKVAERRTQSQTAEQQYKAQREA